MNILTFDLEDWFHILDHKSTRSDIHWIKYESRLKQNTDRIIGFLQEKNLSATFFCLGWIAEKHPDIIKTIDSLGYEIGVHSYSHQLIYEQTRDEFRNDTERSIKTIEDIIGKKVISYRAPGFSLMHDTTWALQILAKNGIEIDCSIFPAKRGHGGFPEFQINKPCLIEMNGIKLKEFPLNTFNFLGKNLVFSGGGYFRLLPYSVIRNLTKKNDYIMTYFHPRDFDPEQPLIKDLPLSRKFKSYYGLKTSYNKLERWSQEFSFVDLKEADRLTDWTKIGIMKLETGSWKPENKYI